MSSRPPPAASDIVCPTPLTRRALVATIAVAPALPAPTAAAPPSRPPDDPAVAACDAWLARRTEITRLGRRWSRRERWLAARFPWFRMSEEERRALPEAQTLYEIDVRCDALWSENERLLRRLARLSATNLEGVERKLAVVARAIEAEEFPDEHRLLSSAMSDLRARFRC